MKSWCNPIPGKSNSIVVSFGYQHIELMYSRPAITEARGTTPIEDCTFLCADFKEESEDLAQLVEEIFTGARLGSLLFIGFFEHAMDETRSA